ncbi:MAG: hypothetical protein HYV28_00655 [Ignavibacteriales bacterium]|nr:hypothetical protein [Ignavibacteriales bacterium]
MNKHLIILFLLAGSTFAQSVGFLDFTPSGQHIIVFAEGLTYSAYDPHCLHTDKIKIISTVTGSVERTVSLDSSSHDEILTFDYHDSVLIVVSSKYYVGPYFNKKCFSQSTPMTVKRININTGAIEWSKQINNYGQCLGCKINIRSNKLYFITNSSVVTLNASTGNLIQESRKISSVLDTNLHYLRYSMSRSGRYFAFWKAKFFTFSANDDGGCLTGLDLIAYSARWLYHLSDIPNYLYIYDIIEDKLVNKLKIPYEVEEGTHAFIETEDAIITPDVNCKSKIFDIQSGRITGELIHPEKVYEFENFRPSHVEFEPRLILSPDNNFYAERRTIKIYLSTREGKLLYDCIRGNSMLTAVPMAFSPDSRYFVTFSDYRKISLYDLKENKLQWVIAVEDTNNIR